MSGNGRVLSTLRTIAISLPTQHKKPQRLVNVARRISAPLLRSQRFSRVDPTSVRPNTAIVIGLLHEPHRRQIHRVLTSVFASHVTSKGSSQKCSWCLNLSVSRSALVM